MLLEMQNNGPNQVEFTTMVCGLEIGFKQELDSTTQQLAGPMLLTLGINGGKFTLPLPPTVSQQILGSLVYTATQFQRELNARLKQES